MKKIGMRIAVFAAAVALAPAALVAQNDPNSMNAPVQGAPSLPPGVPSPTASPTMRDTLGAPGLTGQEMSDAQFIRAAADGGMAEVTLGMLAVEKGGPDVKAFGQKMVDDHTAMNKDIAAIADTLGVMLAKKMSKDAQAEYNKLNGLSGDAFDKEYIFFMAVAHRKDLHDFRTEASVAADPGLQAEVVKAGMVIREHLTMVVKLAADKGITLPPRPPRPAGAEAPKTK